MNVTVPTLRGIIVRDEDDQIIVRASQQEVQRFARGRRGNEVNVRPATLTVRMRNTGMEPAQTWDAAPNRQAGIIRMGGSGNPVLYDEHGLPVAIITEVVTEMMPIGVTAFGSPVQQFASGGYRVQIRAEGMPGVRVE